MLALVVADRHLLGAVEQDVRRHQRRVGEERDPGGRPAAPLLLELDHPAQLPDVHGRLEQVGQLGVGRQWLRTKRVLWSTSGGEQQRGGLGGERPQRGRVVGDGEGVQVGDAVEAAAVSWRARIGTSAPSRLPRVRCPVGLSRDRVFTVFSWVSCARRGRVGRVGPVMRDGRPRAAVSMCVLERGPPVRRATTRWCTSSARPQSTSVGPWRQGADRRRWSSTARWRSTTSARAPDVPAAGRPDDAAGR